VREGGKDQQTVSQKTFHQVPSLRVERVLVDVAHGHRFELNFFVSLEITELRIIRRHLVQHLGGGVRLAGGRRRGGGTCWKVAP
jgi:hypothetical protein